MKTPSECFRDNVLPRWQSYLNDPDKEWKAQDAAKAVNSHLEWVYWYYAKTDPSRLNGANDVGAFRDRLCLQVPDIAVVKDIADAASHRFLTRGAPNRTIISSTAGIDEIGDRLYLAPDGRDVLEIIRAVVSFWRNWPD